MTNLQMIASFFKGLAEEYPELDMQSTSQVYNYEHIGGEYTEDTYVEEMGRKAGVFLRKNKVTKIVAMIPQIQWYSAIGAGAVHFYYRKV